MGLKINQATSLQREREEQMRWSLRNSVPSRQRVEALLSRMLENEFRDLEEMQERIRQRLQEFLLFAVRQVPYYREMIGKLDLRETDFSSQVDLSIFPPLTKTMLREHRDRLMAESVPDGYEAIGGIKSSGTTGEPVQVRLSRRNAQFFGVLKQRELRWFRYAPTGLMAYIRPPDEFPHQSYDDRSKTYHSNQWPYVSNWFETSRAIGCDILLPIDDQLQWLRENHVEYLTVEAGVLESLAFGQENFSHCQDLKGIQAVATQLTTNMRIRAQEAFELRIDQNYGLNEIGIVASRCPEGGRYHVHIEHCLVEIVDEHGQACRPGETGRILVTGLNNLAMPLIRYDTDDMAEVVEGPCPCGRTLPSFERITGRYRRTAYLPGNTWQYWESFRNKIESIPAPISKNFRQYQLHQFQDGAFEFRFISVGDSDSEFTSYVSDSWKEVVESVAPGSNEKFDIRRVDFIPKGMGRKYQNFTSDFSPNEDG